MAQEPNVFLTALDRAQGFFLIAEDIFLDDLLTFPWFDYFYTFYFGSDERNLILSNQLLDHIGDFFNRIAFIPGRVLAEAVIDFQSFAPKWKHKVVRADEMLRFVLREIVDAGFEMATGNVPPLWSLSKRITGFVNKWKFFTALDATAGLKIIKGKVLGIVLIVLRIIFIIAVSIGALAVIQYLKEQWATAGGEKRIGFVVLSQNSKRKYGKRSGQYRVNAGPGPDR